MKTRLFLILTVFAISTVSGQLIAPKIAQKVITGKLRIKTTDYNEDTRILAVYVGRDPGSYQVLPKELYPHLRGFEGKHVIIKGKTSSSPGMQNSIRVKSAKDVYEKGTVTLKGTVVTAMIKNRRMIMLKSGKLLYTPLDEIGMTALNPFRDKAVAVTCYMAGVGMESRRIDEIVDIVLREIPAAKFQFPNRSYLRLLKEEGRFGTEADGRNFPGASDKVNLGENITLKAGAPITSIADGTVKYAGPIPSGRTRAGKPHWGMGHVIVIEHLLARPDAGMQYICAVYTCLGKELKVKTGDQVERDQLIGLVGRPKSEENGKYPAHLHLGLHKGPYNQLSPAQKRELIIFTRGVGLPGKDGAVHKGEVKTIKLVDETFAELTITDYPRPIRISLMVQPVPLNSDAKPAKPVPGWLQMYGSTETLDEWLKPSAFIKKRK